MAKITQKHLRAMLECYRAQLKSTKYGEKFDKKMMGILRDAIVKSGSDLIHYWEGWPWVTPNGLAYIKKRLK